MEYGIAMSFAYRGVFLNRKLGSLISKSPYALSSVWIAVFFLAVSAAVDFVRLIGQEENLVKLLLDRGDTTGIFAGNDILDKLWQMQDFFLDDLIVLDDIDSNVMVDKAQNVKV